MSDNVMRYSRVMAIRSVEDAEDVVQIEPDPDGMYVLYTDFARVEAELVATKKAKAENDERFMIERDEARAERDRLLAVVERLKSHAATSHGIPSLQEGAVYSADLIAEAPALTKPKARKMVTRWAFVYLDVAGGYEYSRIYDSRKQAIGARAKVPSHGYAVGPIARITLPAPAGRGKTKHG